MNLDPRFRRFTSRITLAAVGALLCANGLQAKEEPSAFEVEQFRGELLETGWDMAYDNRSNVVDVYVLRLRAKIDAPFGRSSLETVRGAGYRLVDGPG